MKLKFVALALSIISTILPSNAFAAWKHNPLIGVSGGIAQRSGHVDYGFVYDGEPNFPRSDFELEVVDQGSLWGGFIGYQSRCDSWIFGLEAKLDWQENHEPSGYALTDIGYYIGFTGAFDYHRSVVFGLSGRVAYQMSSEFIAYMRGGVETSRDSFEATIAGNPAAFPFGISLETEARLYYPFVGLGAEFPLFKTPLALRFEYNYHFRAKALELSGFIIDSLGVLPFFELQTHPKTHTLFASLVWNMNLH